MTTSASTSYDLSRTAILRNAYQMIGVVPAGEDPDTNQLAMGSDFLNMRLKALQNRGIILTRLERTTTTLVAAQAEYSTSSDTLDIDDRTVYVTNSAGTDLPVKVISRGMYMRLTVKDSQAQPTQMYIERGETVTFFLYPVPDASWVSITYPRILLNPDMDTAAVTSGLKAKYLRGIVLGVASDLAFAHGLLQKQQQLDVAYEREIGEAVNDDTERGPLRFIPDYGTRFGRRY